MKNYVLDRDKSIDFILNYTIKGNNIIINTASKEKITVPNTEEYEKNILKNMKKQVKKYAYQYENHWQSECDENFTIVKAILINALIWTPLWIFTLPVFLIPLVGVSALLIMFMIFGTKYKISKANLEDAKKNIMFIENEEDINKYIAHANVLSKMKSDTDKVTLESNKLNINSIDKIKYKELKRMLEAMKSEQECENFKEYVGRSKTYL